MVLMFGLLDVLLAFCVSQGCFRFPYKLYRGPSVIMIVVLIALILPLSTQLDLVLLHSFCNTEMLLKIFKEFVQPEIQLYSSLNISTLL